MINEFHCSKCRQTKTHDDGGCGGTGYAQAANGRKVCYACMADVDRARMARDGSSEALPLYLSPAKADGGAHAWKVGNWPGTLAFPVASIRVGRHNLAGRRVDVWFAGPGGEQWHGVQYGETTQIVHCRRIRR